MGTFFSKLHSSSDTQMTEAGNQYALTFQNSRIAYIQGKFLYSPQDITNFHKIFRIMDNQGTGYITIENIFCFLEEELNSIVSPYLEYLFQLIEKETEDKITFPEWLPSISLYCLYSREQIIGFVFQMLDNDHDNNIQKKDLMNFLVQERFNQKIFPFNYVKAVELMDIERPDKINLDLFRKIQMQIPFICYPAFRLQQSFKKKVLGYKFWQKTYEKIKTKEADENKSKQADRFKEELKKKQQIKIDNKIEKFNNQMHKFEIVQNIFKKDRSVRRKKRSQINCYQIIIIKQFRLKDKCICRESLKPDRQCVSIILKIEQRLVEFEKIQRSQNIKMQIEKYDLYKVRNKVANSEEKKELRYYTTNLEKYIEQIYNRGIQTHSLKGIDISEEKQQQSKLSESESMDQIIESEMESGSQSIEQSQSNLNSQQKYINNQS